MPRTRSARRDKTVVVFGAGATKACGGPLTNEILPQAFRLKKTTKSPGAELYKVLGKCLAEHFHVPKQCLAGLSQIVGDATDVNGKQFPALPLFLSLLDVAIDRDHVFPDEWDRKQLQRSRDAVEYAIFTVLEHHLAKLKIQKTRRYYRDFLMELAKVTGEAPNVIWLNYDIIADNALFFIGQKCLRKGGAMPDYGCDIKIPAGIRTCTYGTLLKLHGSLNWLYCPGCDRLDLAMSKACWRTVRAIRQLYKATPLNDGVYKGRSCKECKVPVRPILITPTHSKDYRNPHVAQIWYNAERLLHEAKRVYIIGYSLPEDDVEVTYLLRRGLEGLDSKKITIVEYDPEGRNLHGHSVGLRYRSIFGSDVCWEVGGFETWQDWIDRPRRPSRNRSRKRKK